MAKNAFYNSAASSSKTLVNSRRIGDKDGAGALTDVEFWLSRQSSVGPIPEGGISPHWLKHVSRFLARKQGFKFLEVGVMPGNTLLFFASHYGYDCTGIDFSPKIEDLNSVFAAQGIEAQLILADFLTWKTEEMFDLVYSRGFIEHFSNYQAIIEKHWSLVRRGGMMLLIVPTLTPIQRIIRILTYKKKKMQEVLSSHNLNIMNLNKLYNAVKQLRGSDILVSSYISEMTIWLDYNTPGVRYWTRALFIPIRLMEKFFRLVGISSRYFSPEVLALVRKT